jgi:DNA-binding transcriptional LysR family regulator
MWSVTLEDLRVLTAVADHLNLSAAARALGCTQAAVSQHIRRLEADLGTPLLVRGRRGSSLTPAGERYSLAASEALGALARGERAVRELTDPSAGALRVATGGTTLRHFMRPTVATFRTSYPETRLELHSAGSTRRCLTAVRRDQADLAFVTLGEPLAGFDTLTAIETGWTLVVPTARKALLPAVISVTDLANLDHISLHPTSVSAQQLNRQLVEANVAVDNKTNVDDWDTAIVLVDLGLGVAIVPALHAYSLQASYQIEVIPISDLDSLQFGWAAADQRLLPSTAQTFVQVFAAHHGGGQTPHVRFLQSTWKRPSSEAAVSS